MKNRARVLVATGDTLGEKMAGPAIRAWRVATTLTSVADVRLVSTTKSTLTSDLVDVQFNDEAALRENVEWCDVVVFQGHLLHHHPWIAETDVMVVADIYDPMHLESLEQGRYLSGSDRANFTLQTVEVLNKQIERADLMLCASEKQRDFWLGQLTALGRVNPLTYDADNSLRSLLAVVPFGIDDHAPVQSRHAIKGAVPGIGPDDEVILWGGGIYNWFDPLTLIRAMELVARERPQARLFFMGMAHPNPDVPVMQMATAAQQLSDELGLTDRIVFFNHEWVGFEDRVNYLSDADIGVSTHFDHIETAYSFRTRVLDYLWAALPVVSTGGDTFEAIIRDKELGRVVEPEDVGSLAAALLEALDPIENARLSANARAYSENLRWSRVLEPLIEFCRNPHVAPDRAAHLKSPRIEHLEGLTAHVARIEGSASWRLTGPLRTMLGFVRTFPQRGRRD